MSETRQAPCLAGSAQRTIDRAILHLSLTTDPKWGHVRIPPEVTAAACARLAALSVRKSEEYADE